ncbi:MAG: SoxR reducing system RseC family protein [Clostridiales bacterium]|nr:SoxR reducing system RseC family protein [Clostridiales bacterium]MCD8215573.1 SoxR reducing system RseC family protein [Clostridiales bacterium]
MAEVGKVIACEGDQVRLVLKRREACGKCRACTAGLSEQDMEMKARNLCGAAVGDSVEVTIEQTNFLKAVIIMYGIPLIVFLIGILAGYYGGLALGITNPNISAIILGVVLTAAVYIVIHLNESKWSSGEFLPSAVKIASEESKETTE